MLCYGKIQYVNRVERLTLLFIKKIKQQEVRQMNKSLRGQIEEGIFEQKSRICPQARNCAESDFGQFSKKIQRGDFEVIAENEIEVTIKGNLKRVLKMSNDSEIWRKAYWNRISQLFNKEKIKVIAIEWDDDYAEWFPKISLKLEKQSF